MMYSYLIITVVLFLLSLIIDLVYPKAILKYPAKLLLTLLFIFSVAFFVDFSGILLQLWEYPLSGTTGISFLYLPLEEYLFIATTPYEAIVSWEVFHKIRKR